MKKFLACLSAICICLAASAAACAEAEDRLATEPLTIEHELKFGGVYLHMTIEDFRALGFEFGDSVDITFSSGQRVEDLPFYSGYYVKFNEPLLVGYPGYPYIDYAINNGPDAFNSLDLQEDCTAVVSLHEKGKYGSVQDAMDMVYSVDRADFASDEIFANFRPLTAGGIRENFFYRSASPCDDSYNRASYASRLCEREGIRFLLDLADDEAETEQYAQSGNPACTFWRKLQQEGKVLPLSLAANYRAEKFASGVASALRAVLTEEGPFLVHCTEGKDRTGFFCLLVGALCGGTADELEQDYMITYDNFYGVSQSTAPEKYKAVRDLKFNEMLCFLCEVESVESITPEMLSGGAEQYLRFGGMNEEEIAQLRLVLTEKNN